MNVLKCYYVFYFHLFVIQRGSHVQTEAEPWPRKAAVKRILQKKHNMQT